MMRIKVTIPKKLFKDIRIRDSIEKIMRSKTEDEIFEEFAKVVGSWKDPPNLESKTISTSRSIKTQVYPDGSSKGTKVFRIVNQGSPPHPIMPRRKGGLLRFQRGYISATLPGSLRSIPSQRFGSWMNSSGIKQHPGFAPRKFDEQIGFAYMDTFEEDVQAAIDRAVKEFEQ